MLMRILISTIALCSCLPKICLGKQIEAFHTDCHASCRLLIAIKL